MITEARDIERANGIQDRLGLSDNVMSNLVELADRDRLSLAEYIRKALWQGANSWAWPRLWPAKE